MFADLDIAYFFNAEIIVNKSLSFFKEDLTDFENPIPILKNYVMQNWNG